ncbi:polymorphic toxin type 35 domain-containing protein [Clostridium sporogenes]|nr:polymorphic toxin type 35 domain-containing protein [Clostridium sporogenes]
MGTVMESGGEDVCKNGTSKVKLINGELVQITYRKLQNGIIKIGDAWIK